MANLACVGSHSINGVAALHTELLKSSTLRDFHELWPEKFFNITNGVTPRRWMALCNPNLASLISSRVGEGWIRETAEYWPKLEQFADDKGFQAEWRMVKLSNKKVIASIVESQMNIAIDPQSMFDVHVKRIHEYKRQHLKGTTHHHPVQQDQKRPQV